MSSGSVSGKPASVPRAPISTAREVRPSPRVLAFGVLGRRADPAPEPGAGDRDRLIANEPDEGRRHHPVEVAQRLRAQQVIQTFRRSDGVLRPFAKPLSPDHCE